MANLHKNAPASVHVKKGDTVVVTTGRDAGKKGEVLRVLPKQGEVVVAGVNMITRATKPSPTNPQGGLVKKEAPMWSSKVMLWCPACDKATRVGHKFLGDGQKVRACRKCGEQLDK